MTEKERGDIMCALKELSEADKQFMLGYAAGRSASVHEATEDSDDDKETKKDG